MPAQAEVIECRMKPDAASGGYITDVYYFEFNAETKVARVNDGVIQYVYKEPIAAKMSESTAKKFVFSWNVLLTNGTGQQTKMQYRAAIFRGNKTITVRATPGGYDNSFEARGTCK
jgi:hypothetical protein